MLEGFRKLSLIRFLDQPIASSTTRKMFTGGKSYFLRDRQWTFRCGSVVRVPLAFDFKR